MKFLGIILSMVCVVKPGNSLTCLRCDGVSHPEICTTVASCNAGETCGIETYRTASGAVLYNLGCAMEKACLLLPQPLHAATTTQVSTCNKCCDNHDLCNFIGCNSTGFPAVRGPVCYSCEAYEKGNECRTISHCETHEICFNDASLEFQSNIVYSSGCRSKHACIKSYPAAADISLLGRRTIRTDFTAVKRTTQLCTSCCQGDLCNTQCQKSVLCDDDTTCQVLMKNFDVCKSTELAEKFCKKSCNLCPGPAVCTDLRLDCSNIYNQLPNICEAKQKASAYGCLSFCGFCQDGHSPPTIPPSTISTASRQYISTETSTVPTAAMTMDHSTTKQSITSTPSLSVSTSSTVQTSLTTAMHSTQTSTSSIRSTPQNLVTTSTESSTTSSTTPTLQTTSTTTPTTVSSVTTKPSVATTPTTTSTTTRLSTLSTTTSTTTRPSTLSTTTSTTTRTSTSTKSTAKSTATPSTAAPTTTTPTTTVPTSSTTKTTTPSTTTTPTTISTKSTTTSTAAPSTAAPTTSAPTTTVPTSSTTKPTTQSTTTSTTVETTTATTTATTPPPTYGPALGNLLYIGARVQRGRDWKWGSQDGRGPGTIMAVAPNTPHGWVLVDWDNGVTNTYRMGAENAYDLMFVMGTYNPPFVNN